MALLWVGDLPQSRCDLDWFVSDDSDRFAARGFSANDQQGRSRYTHFVGEILDQFVVRFTLVGL